MLPERMKNMTFSAMISLFLCALDFLLALHMKPFSMFATELIIPQCEP